MSYTALYRKFRPAVFEDVKGQDHIVSTLKNQIKTGRIGHAYLFCGTRGTGKTTIAKIFAKSVNCENPVEGSPCGECPSCKAIADGASMNVIEIDAASNNGVDNIREIIEEVAYSPVDGRYKVYIIDEVHMLSAGAFNALLKTLEEPPKYVIFILATTEVQKIPITVLSRCQRYD
ncbi:MAG TPA: DNA polymerase III, subunit gamma and tau, partial [Lachnospiraceae bacterium]|nr:DNA polymerase III, subunit gamma and tau [Lachnospiraceae bacterium]